MKSRKKLFIISGVSGAGKSQVLKIFEDFGFFCIDNLPLPLLDQFADFLARNPRRSRVALGIDIREGRLLKDFPTLLKALKKRGLDPQILFLDASDDVLIQRFSETRHRHPLGLKVGDALREERSRLLGVKELADKVIETSKLTLGELKEAISETLGLTRTKEMILSVVSFGYKYGIPRDADIVMDVRFLPNPNYVARLRRLTGLSPSVQRYVMSQAPARDFLKDFLRLIETLLPQYVREGKSYLTVAVGCTGGKHRSVCLTHHIARALKRSGHPIMEFHRDLNHL